MSQRNICGLFTYYLLCLPAWKQLDTEDIEEMTHRVAAGLKSWLNFGVAVTGNPKQQPVFEPSAACETQNRLKVVKSTTVNIPRLYI